jgi:hypothetical protein
LLLCVVDEFVVYAVVQLAVVIEFVLTVDLSAAASKLEDDHLLAD